MNEPAPGPVPSGEGGASALPESAKQGLSSLPGYADCGFTPTLQPPTNPYFENSNDDDPPPPYERVVPQTVQIIEEEVLAAVSEYVERNCCYGSADQLKVRGIEMKSAFKYNLISFTEKRETVWKSEAYINQPLEGPCEVSGPWGIRISPDEPFKEHVKQVRVPQTGQLRSCHHCAGRGTQRCTYCTGTGMTRCSVCSGLGQQVVHVSGKPGHGGGHHGHHGGGHHGGGHHGGGHHGGGHHGGGHHGHGHHGHGHHGHGHHGRHGPHGHHAHAQPPVPISPAQPAHPHHHHRPRSHIEHVICVSCAGAGRCRCIRCNSEGWTTCNDCNGRGKLYAYLKLIVTWKNYRDEFISDSTIIPPKRMSKAQGHCAVAEQHQRVVPFSNFPDSAINDASRDLIRKHANSYSSQMKIVEQKQTVDIIRIAEVQYTWGQGDAVGIFHVYGDSNAVYFPDYPDTCACCAIL